MISEAKLSLRNNGESYIAIRLIYYELIYEQVAYKAMTIANHPRGRSPEG